MSNHPEISPQIMTADRLRQHLFGSSRVPFWNFDSEQMTFGLEVEYFIAKNSIHGLQLAGKEQYSAVCRRLIESFGYSDQRSLSPGRISKDTESGFIAIKPDFAWHILEIAFPPRKSQESMAELLEKTLREVDLALRENKLERLDISCLPEVPNRIEFVDLDRLKGFSDSSHIDRFAPLSNLRIFPALIVATHVHVNCSDESSLKSIPKLYQLEGKAIERFTRAKTFRGESFSNLRSELYEQTFGPNYHLRTIPNVVPDSLEMYVELMNRSDRLFPNDRFFPVRDMSYIRPTPYGTIEFRSSCSFKSIDRLLEIVAFRRDQVLSAHNMLTGNLRSAANA